jgi:hypothetical protein
MVTTPFLLDTKREDFLPEFATQTLDGFVK